MGPSADVGARELRRRAVTRFLEEYGSATVEEGKAVDEVIHLLHSLDLNTGQGIHFVQEVRLLAVESNRLALDSSIQELLHLSPHLSGSGISPCPSFVEMSDLSSSSNPSPFYCACRQNAAESIYRERFVAVKDGASWAKYTSISASPEDEFGELLRLELILLEEH